jgi:hypothetical protein
MLSLLVISAARRKLLVKFLTHPGERFYLSQLIRDLGITSSAAQKELADRRPECATTCGTWHYCACQITLPVLST